MRHDGQLELGAIDCVHGQAGAIDGDRAFVRDVLGQLFRCTDTKLDGAGIITARNHFAYTIDMATDQVTAQAGSRRQGFFQVYPATTLEVDEGRAVEGFAAHISPEAIAWQLHRRQADAVDRDAVAQFDVAQVELAGRYIDPHIATFGGQ
ncbi:hypothetical protein D3C85_847680 [compost metagenome]